jgi:rubrerythrin
MARITRVAQAQQRYEQVPVIDPATGEQRRTPVMKNGKQRVTKRGNLVFLSVTKADKSKPLPPRKCGKCHQEIQVGSPYKHISPRSGPYGGRTLYRCDTCPDWHVWEYSSSLSARTAEISHNFWESFNGAEFESTDDVQELLNETAEAIREIASEKEESADNIESGFGHETEQSQELRDVSEQLNSWADEVENVSLTDYPETEEQQCEACDGNGHRDLQEQLVAARKRLEALQAKFPTVQDDLDVVMITKRAIDNEVKLILELKQKDEAGETTLECEECDGSGVVDPEVPTQDQLDEWRSEVESEVSIVDECPV